MSAPPVPGWPDAGCVGCSMAHDQFGRIEHFPRPRRHLLLPGLSRAAEEHREISKPHGLDVLSVILPEGSDFNKDFGRTTDKGENYGLSVFIHDGEDIYRTYFTDGRGVEGLNIWTFLDLTSSARSGVRMGRLPLTAGRTQTWPYVWWRRRHDEYEKGLRCTHLSKRLPLLQSRSRSKPSHRQGIHRSSPPRLAKASNGSSPPHQAGADAQMPAMRGGLSRTVHRHWHHPSPLLVGSKLLMPALCITSLAYLAVQIPGRSRSRAGTRIEDGG